MSEVKKVALLGMPGYVGLTPGAAKGFYRATTGEKLELRASTQDSSLLAHNMNILWTWALNSARKPGGVHYFAMQHSDIEPDDFWLDALIAEMEAKDLDVLGVVVPIKDIRGVTSTAVGRHDNATWRVNHRLTLREVYRLPETFTSEDVGGPLLLNTGLWVCKFNEAWARNVHFEINDRIVWDVGNERYVPEVEPEDWHFSRLLHEQGLKIGCTRKIGLGHRGHMAFGNTKPWGEYDWDQEYLQSSTIPGLEDYPEDVPGWLTRGEAAELARLAAGKVVLEVGSYCGKSTVCLARTARSLGAIDTFDGRGTDTPGDTLPLFLKTLDRYGLRKKVNILKGESVPTMAGLPPIFDLVFIDGSHDAASVQADAEAATRLLRMGGDRLLAFHDYHDTDPGVVKVVNELLAGGAELVTRCQSLAVVRPKAEVLQPV